MGRILQGQQENTRRSFCFSSRVLLGSLEMLLCLFSSSYLTMGKQKVPKPHHERDHKKLHENSSPLLCVDPYHFERSMTTAVDEKSTLLFFFEPIARNIYTTTSTRHLRWGTLKKNNNLVRIFFRQKQVTRYTGRLRFGSPSVRLFIPDHRDSYRDS